MVGLALDGDGVRREDKAAGGAATSIYRLALEGLLDKYQDEIKSRADEITDKLEEEFINIKHHYHE